MKRVKFLLALTSVCFVMMSLNVFAESTSQSTPPKDAQKRVCKEDIKKFCAEVKKGKGRIIDCLGSHSAELNAECKAKVDEIIKGKEACKADAEKLCKGKKVGEGLGVCMKENVSSLSADCQSFTEKAKARREMRKERRAKKQAKQSAATEAASDELEDDLED